MRAFLAGCTVAVLIAVGAAAVLTSRYVPDSVADVFSTQGVRL
jgi:hypothetical protein